jgi:hypothetical protein
LVNRRGVGSLARSLKFDKTSEGVVDCNGIVGTDGTVCKGRLADENDVIARRECSHVQQELLEGSA